MTEKIGDWRLLYCLFLVQAQQESGRDKSQIYKTLRTVAFRVAIGNLQLFDFDSVKDQNSRERYALFAEQEIILVAKC
ncbi:MAG: hypothetical protein V7L26_17640 [Nostoc sp.]|uniref:hypothetical protein n=1 Tax=Nostoc sp. TaxID=1180 RepID=UPI002FFB0E46